jgi:hypothetical protein
MDDRPIDQVLGDEPDLHLVCADHVANQYVIGAVSSPSSVACRAMAQVGTRARRSLAVPDPMRTINFSIDGQMDNVNEVVGWLDEGQPGSAGGLVIE